jgi:Nif-specific regulatory protein
VAETAREPAIPPSEGNRDRKSLKELERREIEAALRRNGWVQVRAARDLGLTERQMGYRIKKFGLNRYDSFRE